MPLDYRRILGLVEYSGHASVIRSYLGRFSRAQVEAWLREFEELQLIEPAPAPETAALDFTRKATPPQVEPEDKAYYDDVLSFADISLSRLGVYLPYERISHRPRIFKPVDKTTALVVEDDPDQMALAVRRLTNAGYRVDRVDCVAELSRYLQAQAPDAMYLDINLPDGDGFSVLTEMRVHPVFTSLPVIMLTARTAAADVARGLALAADGYVTKPYGANTLDYVLRCLMKQEVEASVA